MANTSPNNVNSYRYDPYYTSGTTYAQNLSDSLILRKNSGIFGIPYQFLDSVDRRIGDNKHYSGRKYSEKILGRLPLLMLTPCEAEFMEGFSDNDKGSVIEAIMEGGATPHLDSTGRFYTAAFKFDEYWNIVNRMSTVMTSYMGIGDQEVIMTDGSPVKLSNINWQYMVSDEFKNIFNSFAEHRSVMFYVDGLTTISDSFSNSTTESSLASSINGFSDQAKEIRFLLGNESIISKAADVSDSILSGLAQGASNFTEKLTGGMLGQLATTGVSTVLTGGKLLFPKIWGDSQFSRSYSFDIKLRSPDRDTLSIFMNVIAPYLHLLGLAMPKTLTNSKAAQSPNAYTAPFLVKAYAKGMFNINMGIITDLSATRGQTCEWNDDGLPTQIDISLTIEDLYSALAMTDCSQWSGNISNNWDLVTNTEFMDFLANLGGLNVATDIHNRKAIMLSMLEVSGLARGPASTYMYFDNAVSNKLRQLWDLLN